MCKVCFDFRFFIRLVSLVLVFILFAEETHAQPPELSTTSNRARRAFQDAVNKYNMRDVEGAAESFREAIRHDPRFIEAYIVMGEMFQTMQQFEEAVKAYQEAVKIDPAFYPNIFSQLAESALYIGEYQLAHESILQFLENPRLSTAQQQRAQSILRRSEFALHAIANPVPFEPENLGPAINGPFDEYAPTLTADEQTLIFTRKEPRRDTQHMEWGREVENFFVSYRENGEWTPAVDLGPPINTQYNEGAQSISADGLHLYFTGCNRPGGHGSCDIYYSRRVGNNWSPPVNLGPPVNGPSWDSQPSIAPDGRTLYFVSNRRGNIGRMDIWTSVLQEDGRWSDPVNLGPVINTTGREMSPFIHPDNRTLYFASDGHLGMGGLDLFYSVRDEEGNWQTPVNLGYPINTHADEMSLVVGASGREAYFASEQSGGQGRSDLYFFELYEEARPNMVTYMKGFVFDAHTRRRLRASFELVDVQNEEILVQSFSDDRTGEFLIPIPAGRNLALNVWRDGYLFFSENFSFADVRTGLDPHLYDIPLQPIREGETVVLRNIFFETDSHDLLPESLSELQRLFNLLTLNPGLKIEISGHTDSTGSFAYNKTLSQNRALSVYNFLVEKGIDRSRLSYTGYADTQPVAGNDTEEGRARNRRTEFKVISNAQ